MVFRVVQHGALVMLLLTGMVLPALAQQLDQSLVQPFRQAEAYLSDGEYERAAEAFEELYERSPSTYVFFDRLLRVYEETKQYEEALAIVDRHIEGLDEMTSPVRWIAEKGRIYHLKGNFTEAEAAWEEALAAQPSDEMAYRYVYSSMADVRHFEGAIEVLNRGRERLGNELLFISELGQLYTLSGLYADATREYVRMLADDERRLSFVRSRMRRMLDQEGALEAGLPIVRRAVQEDPLHRGTRELLGWMYLEAEMYDSAYDTYRAIDRLEQEDGAFLLHFAETASEGEAFDVAIRAFDDVLGQDAGSAVTARALAGRGHALERWALANPGEETDSLLAVALGDYQRFAQDYPDHPDFSDVLRRTAGIYQDVLHEYEAAERILERIIEHFAGSDTAHEAQFDLGRLAIKQGQLSRAQLIFSRLGDSLRTGALAERARYQVALLHFYQGELESASTLATALERNTSSSVANDAIELNLLIREHMGPDSLNTALRDYAEARLTYRQGRYDLALEQADQILIEHAGHPIGDRAQFLKATTLREIDRLEDAVKAYYELAERYRLSPLADRSLFEAARLQEQHGLAEEAVETYLQLLSDFPGSLLAPDVRTRIRTLQSDGA